MNESDNLETLIGRVFYYNGNFRSVDLIFEKTRKTRKTRNSCIMVYGDKLQILNLSEDKQSILVEIQDTIYKPLWFQAGCREKSLFYLPKEVAKNEDFDNNITFFEDQILIYKRQGPVTLVMEGIRRVNTKWFKIVNPSHGKRCVIIYGDIFKRGLK